LLKEIYFVCIRKSFITTPRFEAGFLVELSCKIWKDTVSICKFKCTKYAPFRAPNSFKWCLGEMLKHYIKIVKNYEAILLKNNKLGVIIIATYQE
jgi:hypothetical protein